ncbi:MAG: cytochrome c [Bacteroidales bacterium]|nr:cytochrome c [Bacteroidales bacterium]
MKANKVWFLASLIFVVLLGLSAYQLTKDPWKVPVEYKSKKNPVENTKQSISYGKEIYEMSCSSCHGKTGKGDGVKAKNLDIELYDLTSADFHSKFTDGEIYYQSFIGRYRWHDFRSTVKDEEDRWNVVNYVRSLKK